MLRTASVYGNSSPSTPSNVLSVGNVSGTTNIDLLSANTYSFTVTGSTTLTFSNGPATDTTLEKWFYVTNGGLGLTGSGNYPSGSRFPGPGVVGSAPTLVSSGTEILRMKAVNIGGTTNYDWAYIGRVA